MNTHAKYKFNQTEILILTHKLYDEHQYSFIQKIKQNKDTMLSSLYNTNNDFYQSQFKQNWLNNPFTNNEKATREWIFQNELPSLNAKCYYISSYDLEQFKDDIMFMKYNSNQKFIITDEFSSLPLYLETNQFVIKPNDILKYIKDINFVFKDFEM